MLPESDLVRYGRQILYPNFGKEGQKKLKESHVVVVGLGGLGSPASIYLACAGVGHITIVGCGRVDLSNLNRQILHWEEDIGERKSVVAGQKLTQLNRLNGGCPCLLNGETMESTFVDLIKKPDCKVCGGD